MKLSAIDQVEKVISENKALLQNRLDRQGGLLKHGLSQLLELISDLAKAQISTVF
jgi:hypothetical protein